MGDVDSPVDVVEGEVKVDGVQQAARGTNSAAVSDPARTRELVPANGPAADACRSAGSPLSMAKGYPQVTAPFHELVVAR
ncbi:hypothetical protein [Kitasatospora sp. LaBMicrA B282]|uniref:hypothetical protein n=1 Tax=Kitasatospora sp. LaBMicrA B282 TaxID=3420949 RepID=UPI003D13086A